MVTQRKGGVGKTTVAMNLAIYLRQRGREVAFLDLDPQRDGFDFFEERSRLYPELPGITHLALESPQKVEGAMRSLAKAGADTVVDCPPLDGAHVDRARMLADVLVLPFKAGGNDLRAFSRALSLYQVKVERNRNGPYHAQAPLMMAVLNEFRRRQVNDRLLQKWVEGSGLFLFAGCLGHRLEFKDAIARRQSVWEYAPGSSSATEALAVCEALQRGLR